MMRSSRGTFAAVWLALWGAAVAGCGAGAGEPPVAHQQGTQPSPASPPPAPEQASPVDATRAVNAVPGTKLPSTLTTTAAEWYRAAASDDCALGLVAMGGDAAGHIVVLSRSLHADRTTSLHVLSYDSAGTLIWNASLDGADPSALAVSTDGSVSVAGAQGTDALTLRYDSNGALLWSRRSPGWTARDVAVDGQGSVVVAGDDAHAAHVIAYAASGEPRWTATDDGPFHAGAHARHLAIDAAGFAYVAGESSDGNSDQITLWRFDALGSLGFCMRRAENATLVPQTTAEALVVHRGHAYVAGTRAVRSSLQSEPTVQLFVAAYDETGAEVWSGSQSPAARTVPTAIAVDGDERVTVTGFAGVRAPDSFFTAQWASTGALRWSARDAWTAPGEHRANAVAVDAAGTAYVTGTAVDASGVASFGTIAYGTDGAAKWRDTFRDASGAYSTAGAVMLDPWRGAIVLAGSVLASPRGVVGVRHIRSAP